MTGMATLGTLTGEFLRRYVCNPRRRQQATSVFQLAKVRKHLVKNRVMLKEDYLNGENNTECAICLEILKKDEEINELKCNSKHVFHH